MNVLAFVFFTEYKDKAFSLVKGRIKYFNKKYDFAFNKINIKNQKTRWGSCSKHGNLNFSYNKINFYLEIIKKYIV